MKIVVSIIIPCYKVEKYVEQCIRSIISQTYDNIEIIPVDDGSPDNTPYILDKLSQEDNRINVIHKQNAGVSAARNSGLNVATGDYVVFVDGDDFLAKDYVEYMLQLSNINDSDFVLSQNCFMSEAERQIKNDFFKTISPEEATALLISPRIMVGCWNKMFKRKFLIEKKLLFNTNLFYGEGLNFITKVAQLSNHVTIGNRKVYYYRRNNDTSATSKYNIQKYFNGEKAIDVIESELILKASCISLMLRLHRSMFCLGALSQTYAHGLQSKYKEECHRWRAIIKSNLPYLIVSNRIPLYRKALLIGGFLFPNIICKLDMWRRKRIAQQSVR